MVSEFQCDDATDIIVKSKGVDVFPLVVLQRLSLYTIHAQKKRRKRFGKTQVLNKLWPTCRTRGDSV